MIYCETLNRESIAVRPLNDIDNAQYVELIKYGDEPKFAVWVDDGNDEWLWTFDMTCLSDYERVKLSIFDAIFACETMTELTYAFDAIFTSDFEDILIEDEDECDCCGCCGGCEFVH